MPRLRHKSTGLFVVVDEERAGRLGSEWEPATAEKPKLEPAPRRRKRNLDED